jgi:hypothetical protein
MNQRCARSVHPRDEEGEITCTRMKGEMDIEGGEPKRVSEGEMWKGDVRHKRVYGIGLCSV